jgi:7-keto-8-aminopelargonate synthetase-like enzyme
MEIKKFENNLIAFDSENQMVNATDMLKAFPEKRMNNFLRLDSTKEFMNALNKKLNAPNSAIRKSTGRYGGTYMHKLLAYKFAGWLNAEFELFVYEVFDNVINEKLKNQQRQLDYFCYILKYYLPNFQ